MSEPNPQYILKPGQPSIEKRYGEETTRMTFTLPASFAEYLKSRDVPAAEYLRRLIAADIANPGAGEDVTG